MSEEQANKFFAVCTAAAAVMVCMVILFALLKCGLDHCVSMSQPREPRQMTEFQKSVYRDAARSER